MAWDRTVPFLDGHQQHYPDTYYDIDWVDVKPFRATLITEGTCRGRSSATIEMNVKGPDDLKSVVLSFNEYMSFCLGEHIETHVTFVDMVTGRLTVCGLWTFTKRGQNYFCVPYVDAK